MAKKRKQKARTTPILTKKFEHLSSFDNLQEGEYLISDHYTYRMVKTYGDNNNFLQCLNLNDPSTLSILKRKGYSYCPNLADFSLTSQLIIDDLKDNDYKAIFSTRRIGRFVEVLIDRDGIKATLESEKWDLSKVKKLVIAGDYISEQPYETILKRLENGQSIPDNDFTQTEMKVAYDYQTAEVYVDEICQNIHKNRGRKCAVGIHHEDYTSNEGIVLISLWADI